MLQVELEFHRVKTSDPEAMGNSLTDAVGFPGYRNIYTDQNLLFSSCKVTLFVGEYYV